MKRYVQIAFGCSVLLCASGLSAVRAAQQSPSADWRFGFEGFRMLLESQGLDVVTDPLRFSVLPPTDTVLVVIGDTDVPRVLGDPLNYLRRGGAMLVATDLGDEQYLRSVGIHLRAGPVEVPDGPDAFRGLADCPIISHLTLEHPVFRGVTRIATNRPGYVLLRRSWRASPQPMAWLPDDSEVQGNPIGNQPLIVTMAADRGGRIIAAADHSLFINEMLLHADNGAFAINSIRWLCESGRRRYLLFVQDGRTLGAIGPPRVEPDLSAVSPEALAELPPQSMLMFANSLIAGLEDADVFNQLMAGQPRWMSAGALRRYLLVIGAIIMLLIASAWIVVARAYPRPQPVPVQWTDGLTRRQAALVAGGQLGETARTLAQLFLRSLNGAEANRPSSISLPISQRLPWWRRWRAAYDMFRLRRLSTARRPRVGPRELRRVVARIARLESVLERDATVPVSFTEVHRNR